MTGTTAQFYSVEENPLRWGAGGPSRRLIAGHLRLYSGEIAMRLEQSLSCTVTLHARAFVDAHECDTTMMYDRRQGPVPRHYLH